LNINHNLTKNTNNNIGKAETKSLSVNFKPQQKRRLSLQTNQANNNKIINNKSRFKLNEKSGNLILNTTENINNLIFTYNNEIITDDKNKINQDYMDTKTLIRKSSNILQINKNLSSTLIHLAEADDNKEDTIIEHEFIINKKNDNIFKEKKQSNKS
jgi:hypothetical protein